MKIVKEYYKEYDLLIIKYMGATYTVSLWVHSGELTSYNIAKIENDVFYTYDFDMDGREIYEKDYSKNDVNALREDIHPIPYVKFIKMIKKEFSCIEESYKTVILENLISKRSRFASRYPSR